MSRQHRSPTLITLGRTIRAFRESAGMIQIEVAKQLGYTNAWLSNIETGQIRPRQDQIDAIEELLGIPSGVLLTIQKQHDAESLPGHLRPWPGEEYLATVIRTYQIALVPDLLQTEDYTRALLSGDENAIRARMERQKRPHPRRPTAPDVPLRHRRGRPAP